MVRSKGVSVFRVNIVGTVKTKSSPAFDICTQHYGYGHCCLLYVFKKSKLSDLGLC